MMPLLQINDLIVLYGEIEAVGSPGTELEFAL